MGSFLVPVFVLTSALSGPSAIAELLVNEARDNRVAVMTAEPYADHLHFIGIQITTPAPHQSDAVSATQPTVSKHGMHMETPKYSKFCQVCCF